MQTAKDRFLHLIIQDTRNEYRLFEDLDKVVKRFVEIIVPTIKRVKKEARANLESGRCSKEIYVLEQSELFDCFMSIMTDDTIINIILKDLKEGGLY